MLHAESPHNWHKPLGDLRSRAVHHLLSSTNSRLTAVTSDCLIMKVDVVACLCPSRTVSGLVSPSTSICVPNDELGWWSDSNMEEPWKSNLVWNDTLLCPKTMPHIWALGSKTGSLESHPCYCITNINVKHCTADINMILIIISNIDISALNVT